MNFPREKTEQPKSVEDVGAVIYIYRGRRNKVNVVVSIKEALARDPKAVPLVRCM